MAVEKAVAANPYRQGGDTIFCDGSVQVIVQDPNVLASKSTIAAFYDPGPGGGLFRAPAPPPHVAEPVKAVEHKPEPVKPAEAPKPAPKPEPVKEAPKPAPVEAAKPAEAPKAEEKK